MVTTAQVEGRIAAGTVGAEGVLDEMPHASLVLRATELAKWCELLLAALEQHGVMHYIPDMEPPEINLQFTDFTDEIWSFPNQSVASQYGITLSGQRPQANQ